MKRKEICYLLLCVILYQPIRAFAVESRTDSSIQADVQEEISMEMQEETVGEEVETIQSVFADLTVGAAAIGRGIDTTMADVAVVEKEDVSSNIKDILGDPLGVSAIMEAKKTQEEYAKAYEEAKNANWGYTNLGIANVDNNLNIRAIPGEDGKLVGKLPKDAACEVLESDGEWAHIQSGKVDGYVSCDYLLTGLDAKHRAEELVSTIATVTTETLNVRAEANTDSEIITFVPQGEQLEVVSSEGDWVRVYLDDEEVFVSAAFVEVNAQLNTAITMTELLYGQGVSDVRVDLCQYAKEFLGNPYVWGGTSLTKGADCSGYVLSIYKKFGISLPHYSGSQANCGTSIKLSEAQPGDLVFYGKGSTINHVAIYIGGGQVIHASSPKTGIRISNATYRTPLKVVRILQD
ncbi:MAG: NlpC/P60 family protein [Bacillus sp. (in: Bacteria)]|nr:NlpC/P60 family protein [Bacillus sp. (in: firmicutes)]MCM1426999.1 NlpC/P60 family protein [Eubacterium sp.]